MVEELRAFTTAVVLAAFQKKIEVLEAWEESVLAGLGDGTLVVLRPDAVQPGAPWQVVQALKGFGKKYIAQLQVRCSHSNACCTL